MNQLSTYASPGWSEALAFWNSLDPDYTPHNLILAPASSITQENSCSPALAPYKAAMFIDSSPLASYADSSPPIATTASIVPPLAPSLAKGISFTLLNTHSLVKHCTEIADYIDAGNIDIMAITETWLHPAANHAALLATPSAYDLYRKDRTDALGGGVALIAKSCWNIHTVACGSIDNCELLLTKILLNPNVSITILVIYRPPPAMPSFLDQFLGIINSLLKTNTKMLILGDFNYWANNPNDKTGSSLLDFLVSMGFTMHISEPTQIHGHTLDWVLSHNLEVMDVEVSPCAWSDHHLVKFTLALPSTPKKSTNKSVIQYRNLKNVTPVLFCHEVIPKLLTFPPTDDVDTLASQLRNALNSTVNILAPLKTKTIQLDLKAKTQTWFSDQVIQARSTKRSAERDWRRAPSESTKSLYKLAATAYKQSIITAKANHFNQRISEAASDAHELFRVVSELEGKNSPSLPDLVDNSWCQNIQNALFRKVESHMEKINSKLQLLKSSPSPTTVFPDKYNSNSIPKFVFKPVSESDIVHLVKSMKPTSFKGDLFTASMIQNSIVSLAPFITQLVNKSFSSAKVPTCLKESIITPLLKKPTLDPNDPLSYRPITNASFLLKILDRIAYSQILVFLETHCLLNTRQSGFRKNHGTETALLDLKNNISKIIDEGHPVLLLLLDLSAAFDLVSHNLLTHRLLDLFAFSDDVAEWISSFLKDRSTRVAAGSASAAPTTLSRGVPQGACLSPTLYNLYTRPLFDELECLGVGFTNYADDTQLFLPLTGDYFKDSTQVQKIYAVIQNWMATNQLALNGDKTEILLIGTRQKLSKLSDAYNSFSIEGCSIKVSSSVKTLGVYLDSNFNMVKHALHLKSSCAYILKLLQHIKQYLSNKNLSRVAGALVNSRLDYCNSLMSGAETKVLSAMQVIQNNAVRTVFGVSKREHISHYRRALHWLPVKHRITHKICTITYNCIMDRAPAYLKQHIHSAPCRRALRSTAENKLFIPRFKLASFGGRAFYTQAPSSWNLLPSNMRSLASPEVFKKALKTYLFDIT